jgi:Tfp pilus assembly protein PilV
LFAEVLDGSTTHVLVMIDTFLPRRMASPASEAGDTLIEVIISALLVGIIVVGTFSGLNSTNRATSIDRARSQADAIAEQNEEQVRSYSIKKLNEIEGHAEVKSVKEGNAEYTIETTATYFPESSASSSCSSNAEAGYVQTTSKVTSPALGTGKSVQETGIVSPPAGATLTVQVTESGTALEGATVTATGPAPTATAHTLQTSVHGCAIMAVSPGEYSINASKPNYVDPNGLTETIKDSSPSITHSVYIPAETTAKEAYYLGKAGNLKVGFTTGSTTSEGDTFVAFDSGMTTFREFGTASTYATTVTSPTTLYPFLSSSPYTVYAGTCEADRPSSSVIEANKSNFEVSVPPGGTGEIKTILPPVNIKVMSGTGSGPTHEGTEVTNGAGSTVDACGVKRLFASAVGSTPNGGLPHPGLPFGKYSSICVSSGGRKWEGPAFENNTINGPTVGSVVTPPNNGGIKTFGTANYGMIYLGTSPAGFPTGTSTGECT